MEFDDPSEQWLADVLPPEILATPLPDASAAKIVDCLKQEADRNWHINPNRSLKFAERIMAIGQARNDSSQIALGLMARGDALKLLGQMQEAWDMLEQAGKTFVSIGDEVGWARTRIGRLFVGLELNCINDALVDVDRARAIFIQHGEHDRLLRLDWQTAFVFLHLGSHHRALQLFESAVETAEMLGEAGKQHFGSLYVNIGATYSALGDFREALAYYEQARDLAIAHDESLDLTRVEGNIAEIAQAQGHYQRALTLLHGILERGAHESPLSTALTKQRMVECYLSLNRFEEARDLAQQVIQEHRMFNASYELAHALSCLAMAEVALANLGTAQAALEEAESIFRSMSAATWVATTRLKRARIALKQGDVNGALQEAMSAATYFEAEKQRLNEATATLLYGEAMLALSDFAAAGTAGNNTLRVARQLNIPSLRYAAHLLLGKVAEAQKDESRAMRSYQAAAATIERVQRGLTLTLRPGFLEDKGEALRRLIVHDLLSGNTQRAFETLERAKSQVWLGYLMNHERLKWSQEDIHSQALMEELEKLRTEHQWFYRLAHEPPKDVEFPSAVQPEQAMTEVLVRERRMRSLTEQLYLQSDGGLGTSHAFSLSLKEVQQALDNETLLIEYYNDGEYFWAFSFDKQTVTAHRLQLTAEALNQLMRQLRVNFATALKVGPDTQTNLTRLARRILQQLYTLLVEPLSVEERPLRRLVVVPYGGLHFLPFQLLYNSSVYLIERFEVVTLPAAGLAVRRGPIRAPGARILTHSWEGRLPYTQNEAQIVQRLFGGQIHAEAEANRSILQAEPTQILHIAAHGHHRLDQPDLSYLQLADGQLYTDDVLQEDLSYELVTLSACETGLANVAADEELIGLGRGFLFAGAGALIQSLWGVADFSTHRLMDRMYSALAQGASKAASLREAQQSILAENRDLHPAFWGPFQLIGDASPLSGGTG